MLGDRAVYLLYVHPLIMRSSDFVIFFVINALDFKRLRSEIQTLTKRRQKKISFKFGSPRHAALKAEALRDERRTILSAPAFDNMYI